MNKPEFHIPSMDDVAAARGSTGLKVVSTFSGCGGSCLGFEMAGYEVVWANEFVEAARDTYALNHHHTILDGRDIREVSADEILASTKLKVGELDVLNGSPPCASFSTAGKREKGWGKVKKYSDTEQRTDDLFFEFSRLLTGLQPRAFVAENVAGLTMGSAIGYFKEIMRALDAAGYNVRCKVLDAQWLGVPQSRRRAIFVGTRKDLAVEPVFPKPYAYRYTMREVLPTLRALKFTSGFNAKERFSVDEPCPTVMAGGIAGSSHSQHQIERIRTRVVDDTGGQFSTDDVTDKPCPAIMVRPSASGDLKLVDGDSKRKFSIAELRIVCGFPADFALTGTYVQQWERLGRAVPPLMMREVAATLRDDVFGKLKRVRKNFKEAR